MPFIYAADGGHIFGQNLGSKRRNYFCVSHNPHIWMQSKLRVRTHRQSD